MINDDENDYLDELIELALRDEWLQQIDDLKRKTRVSRSPLYPPHYDTGAPPSCGSTAMAALTGLPISVINAAIRRAYPVLGATNETLLAAMELLGWFVVEEWNRGGGGYTLDTFAKKHGRDGPFIVAVTRHYIAISESEFCDSVTMAPCDLFGGILDRPYQPYWCKLKRLGSTWVHNWWRFEKLLGLQEAAVTRMGISAGEQ